MFYFLVVLSGVKEQTESFYVAAEIIDYLHLVFPTRDLENLYCEYFKWLILHSVRLTAVIAIPNLNYWLFASENIPLPHSFGIDQPVLPWLLKGRFSLETSAAPVGRCWKHTALVEAPSGDSQSSASSTCAWVL